MSEHQLCSFGVKKFFVASEYLLESFMKVLEVLKQTNSTLSCANRTSQDSTQRRFSYRCQISLQFDGRSPPFFCPHDRIINAFCPVGDVRYYFVMFVRVFGSGSNVYSKLLH